MNGWVKVAGLGPGDESLVTDQVRAALAAGGRASERNLFD